MLSEKPGTLLPPPNPVVPYIHVADIKCNGQYGQFTTQVVMFPGEDAAKAIFDRIQDLETRNVAILLVIPMCS